ncbi:general transcription factor IIE subunit 2 [Anopheles nili]|uniref:general transcription factor IIE subunit 2 n=1 Tax=Anopheles nili TaxID=185578 RepID=UPI00237C05E9|nr:general transcription factor IIE subunit 2 [Anopheles nili]
MDPALLREREAFKRRAMATPTVEKKAKTESSFASTKDIKKPRPASAAPKIDATNYKTMSGSSQYRFGVLAKIVKHMRTRHQEGDDHPLTLDDILDETNQLDIGSSVKAWLQGEALRNNPKIELTPDGRYLFKSVFKIKDGKSLMRLLKQHDLKGLGGVLLDDVQESLPHCDKVLKNRASEIIFITRPNDKKKILFYNDRTANFQVDDDFQKLWRAVTVDAMDDAKIDEYLEKQGIRSMQDHGPKKPLIPKRKKLANKKRQFKKPRDNEHLADVLETYEDNTLTQSNAVQEIKQNN